MSYAALAAAVLAGCSGSPATPEVSGQSSPTPSSPTSTATPSSPSLSPSPSRTRSARPGPAEQARLDAALIEAAWANDVDRARGLIRRGADVNHKDASVQSAYLIATSEGYLDLLELTLAHGARVNDKDSFNGTGLIRAADRGHAHVVGRLVRAGIDLDHVNELGWTALHEAVILGDGSKRYLETVRVLLATGVDASIPAARDGLTALQHAEQRGYADIAVLLRRADERPRDRDGMLLRAAGSGDADDVAIALRAGARLEARDADRRTPLLHAVIGDHVAAAKVLVWLGADPSIPDGDGVTALEHAQRRGHDEIAALLSG